MQRKEKAVNGRVRERTVFIINLVTDILYVIEAVTDLILVISFEEKRKEEGADLKKNSKLKIIRIVIIIII